MDKETLLLKLKPSIGELDATTQMYGDTGISARTLDAYIDRLLPAIKDDAEVTDDFLNGHANFLKAIGGQMRHEFSEFVKNYKPKPSPKKDQITPPEQNAELNALKQTVEELIQSMAGQQKLVKEEDVRNRVKANGKSLKVKNQNLWDDVVTHTSLEEGMSEEGFEKAVKKRYEEKLKSYFGEGASPYGGNGSHSQVQKEAEEALDNFFESKAKEGKFPKKNQ